MSFRHRTYLPLICSYSTNGRKEGRKVNKITLALLALIVVRGCFVLIVVGEVKTDPDDIVHSISRMVSLMAIDTRPLPGLTNGNCHEAHASVYSRETKAQPDDGLAEGARPCSTIWPKALPFHLAQGRASLSGDSLVQLAEQGIC